MTIEYLKQLLHKGEHLTLECKKAKSELPKSVWETYSAFANTVGGTILFGVEEDRNETDVEKRFVITGVENVQKIVADFWNTINSNKVNENILLDGHVEVVEIEGKQVVVIRVPPADWRLKPIYLNENVYKGSYKRNHEGDYHCTEAEVKAMIRDANTDGNDGALLEGFTMEDIDPNTLRSYRIQFEVLHADHAWNGVDDKTFLKHLGGYEMDRMTGKEGLTVAGLLMFGRGLSINERFANFRVRKFFMLGSRWDGKNHCWRTG